MRIFSKVRPSYLTDVNEPEQESSCKKDMLHAALSLFLEFGFTSVSLRQIAGHANIKQGSIHKLSGGKERLFSCLIVKASTSLLDKLNTASLRSMSVHNALSSYVESYVRYGLKYRLHHMLFRRDGHLLSADVRSTITELRDQKITRLWEGKSVV